MKPAVDEMFPEGAGPYVDLDEAGGSSGLLMDLAANEKAVHSDFFNESGHHHQQQQRVGVFTSALFCSADFEDLFDDDDLQ
ncbi:COP9 signalosome complex subunit 9 isoform X1 [Oryzias latipes]